LIQSASTVEECDNSILSRYGLIGYFRTKLGITDTTRIDPAVDLKPLIQRLGFIANKGTTGDESSEHATAYTKDGFQFDHRASQITRQTSPRRISRAINISYLDSPFAQKATTHQRIRRSNERVRRGSRLHERNRKLLVLPKAWPQRNVHSRRARAFVPLR